MQFDKEQWRVVLEIALKEQGRTLDPAEYDRLWAEFQVEKARRAAEGKQ